MSPNFSGAAIGCEFECDKTAKPVSNKTIKNNSCLNKQPIQLANSVKVSMKLSMPSLNFHHP